ncbi:MAG TPA: acyl-homoserine-lactone synthase [Pseudomonadales bacterium]|nr:acyl-homoserine-lactone synthase [Pseudomonadales bacterium]
MKNHSLFTVDVFAGNSIPPALLKQYGKLRYKCFDPNDPYLKMDHDRMIELDHFDTRPSTIHIMVTSKRARSPKQLVSAVRLIPTLEEYDLEQPSWSYLTGSITLPKSSEVMEGSRWVGKSSRTYEGTLSTALLMLQLYQLSREKNFDRIIGVIAEKSEQWLEKREANASAGSTRHFTGRDGNIMVSHINIDRSFLEASRRMMLSSMEEWSITHTAVAAVASE